MKAFVVKKYGPDGLEQAEVPLPTPGRHEVLVDIRAASMNPLDKMVRNGEFKQLLKYKRPFTPGHDLSGVVTQVGSEVRDFKVGDQVYSRPRDIRIGAFAEFIAIDAADVATNLPLSFEQAAAVPLVALAAWQTRDAQGHGVCRSGQGERKDRDHPVRTTEARAARVGDI